MTKVGDAAGLLPSASTAKADVCSWTRNGSYAHHIGHFADRENISKADI